MGCPSSSDPEHPLASTAAAPVAQKAHWDCGLACVASVAKVSLAEATQAVPTAAVRNRSIWTVDLAYGLSALGVPALTTTIADCVNPAHSTLGFYQSGFEEDQRRVDALIQQAPQHAVRLERRSVTLDELIRFVGCGEGHHVIALVNSADLARPTKRRRSFVGHFIVISGHCAEHGFVCMDPASPARVRSVQTEVLQRARQVAGTDEDLIFVWPEGGQPPGGWTDQPPS